MMIKEINPKCLPFIEIWYFDHMSLRPLHGLPQDLWILRQKIGGCWATCSWRRHDHDLAGAFLGEGFPCQDLIPTHCAQLSHFKRCWESVSVICQCWCICQEYAYNNYVYLLIYIYRSWSSVKWSLYLIDGCNMSRINTEFELLYVKVFQRMRDSVIRIRTWVYAELFILTK